MRLRRLLKELLLRLREERLKLSKEKKSQSQQQLKKNLKRKNRLLSRRKTMRSPLNWNKLIWRKRNAFKLKRKLDRKNGSMK